MAVGTCYYSIEGTAVDLINAVLDIFKQNIRRIQDLHIKKFLLEFCGGRERGSNSGHVIRITLLVL